MTVSRRKLDALRNLAERPGTEAEGILAKETLERLSRNAPTDPLELYRIFLRTGAMEDLRAAVGENRMCECGTTHPTFTSCLNLTEHARIDAEKRMKFPRGTRVYYNKWAYKSNAPGRVTGYSAQWNWLRVQLDELKNPRSIPVYTALGWHLSTEPIDADTLHRTGLREGMEQLENPATFTEVFG